MSLFLHAHQVLIIATIAFIIGVLLPFWYTSPNGQLKRNIIQICDTMDNRCSWTIIPTPGDQSLQTGKSLFERKTTITTNYLHLVLPVVAASSAIVCVCTSLIGLFLGSWFLQRMSNDCRPKCLLILTIVFVLISCKSSKNDSSNKENVMNFFV